MLLQFINYKKIYVLMLIEYNSVTACMMNTFYAWKSLIINHIIYIFPNEDKLLIEGKHVSGADQLPHINSDVNTNHYLELMQIT